MDATEISCLGTRLTQFLRRFADCFGRSEPREHLRTYIRGQLSDLPRKSVEPIALTAGTPPRTLQRFLESVQWDEQRLRDRQQQFVAREHAHPQAIGVIDESGNPKKGRHTAAVKRQWCGRTGKIDNCVMGVHLSYVAGDFQCLLDSDLFLPQDWADDPVRRAAAFIPDEVGYRKKTDIALAQIQRALSNGIRVAAWTFDAFYGRDGQFLEGLEALGQNYVAEVPSTFTGGLHEPLVLLRPTPQEMRKTGRKRRFPRLARKALPACEVRNLVTCSRVFQKQKWRAFRIKDGQKGPMVREVKHAVFYRKRSDGLAGPAQSLIVARNVLARSEIKFFVSNLVPQSEGVSLEWLLWVAFSRWPIESCFQQAKDELGMDHFEVRGWRGIHRHLYITQLSHLFCARERLRLREKKDRRRAPDRRTGSQCGLGLYPIPEPAPIGSDPTPPGHRETDCLLPASQRTSPTLAHPNDSPPSSSSRYPTSSTALMRAR